MPLLKHNAIVPDTWTELAGEAPLPDTGDVIVPLDRLLKEKDALSRRRNRLGVRLGNTDKVEALGSLLPELDAKPPATAHDASTSALIRHALKNNGRKP